MPKSRSTVHVNVYFEDMGIVDHDEARETVKTVLYDLHHDIKKEMALALESIGAKHIEITTVVY